MRILLRRTPAGTRAVRGGHVMDLQIGLEQTGFGSGGVDGIFGRQTERAVQSWQRSKGAEPTGLVDELTWVGITRSDPPSLFRRCLSLTAAFEGHGYMHAAGNWDNAYITWGIIGFTLRHGNLGLVIRRTDERHPGLLSRVIGPGKRTELLEIVEKNKTEQRRWANDISVPPKRYRIRQDWADAFEALGQRPEVRQIQDEVARDVYYRRAITDFEGFQLEDECDMALCFDTAVQNGGINDEKAELIAAGLRGHEGVTGEERRVIFANAIAEGSNERFREDVRQRRMTIANGEGAVHGATYTIDVWGLEPFAVEEIE
jgi:hypothetical protein